MNENVELCTFPDEDDYYCMCFTVPLKWLVDTLFAMYANERKEKSFMDFMNEYTWDETYQIYIAAQAEQKIISENNQI